MRPCVVCVPARNGAERPPFLLATLAGQDAEGPVRVVVLANNCTDGTADAVRARRFDRLDVRLIEASLAPPDAHVGTARRMALDAGADWLDEIGGEDGILLTTDADARLPDNWISANLRALEQADVVGGRLVIDGDEALGGDAAGLLRGLGETLLAQPIDGRLDVALRLGEGALAIHHAGTRHLAELHHIGSFDFHNCLNLRFTFVCMTFSCLGKTQANLGAAPAREKARVTPPQRLRAPRREFRQRRQPP